MSGMDRQRRGEAAGRGVTDAELLEYVDGIATPATAGRVIRAALHDATVRDRLSRLQRLDALATLTETEGEPELGRDAGRLGDTMRRLVREIAAETVAVAEVTAAEAAAAEATAHPLMADLQELLAPARPGARGAGGGLWHVARGAAAEAREIWETLSEGVTRALVVGRHALSLPCFAPAAAASAGGDLSLRRETVTTADGVRIEFQQLPTAGLSRLRVLVDASLLASEIRELGYNVAFLTLEDSGNTPLSGRSVGGGDTAAVSPPDRHILVVALNGDGRGFTDFQAGNSASVVAGNVLPAAQGVCRLTGITLSRIESKSAASAAGGSESVTATS